MGATAPVLWPTVLNALLPNHASPTPPVARSPVKRRRIGFPLWKVVIPDIVQPPNTARLSLLSNAPRARVGICQLYERLKMWVRSNGSTPQLLPLASSGSMNAAPSLSLTAVVPRALLNV